MCDPLLNREGEGRGFSMYIARFLAEHLFLLYSILRDRFSMSSEIYHIFRIT